MIKEAIEKARAYSDNRDKIDSYYDGYVACYLELNKKLKAEHTRGEIDFVNMHCNSSCKNVRELEQAKEIIRELLECYKYVTRFSEYANKNPIAKAEAFFKE